MINAIFERENFSKRLKLALTNAHYVSNSPTELAREFNIRYSGAPICVQAARKWLHGDALPTQDKLHVLADWLGISSEWLRFGDSNAPLIERQSDSSPRFASGEVKLIADIQRLDEPYRSMARELIQMLIRMHCGND
jgi:transcriptional regulator with XRE-family HTH domain